VAFCQEPIAGVNGIAAGLLGDLEYPGDIKIALRRGRGAYEVRFVGIVKMPG
jgi:hypothetical protein